jgi:hypothetical protein
MSLTHGMIMFFRKALAILFTEPDDLSEQKWLKEGNYHESFGLIEDDGDLMLGQGKDTISTMTSNTEPSPLVASADDEETTYNLLAWRAFNKTNSGWGDCWTTMDDELPHWLKIDLGSAKTIVQYQFWVRDQNRNRWVPSDFKFQGSNDDLVWVDLDERNGITDPGQGVLMDPFTCIKSGLYRYYRLFITKSAHGGKESALGQLFLYELVDDNEEQMIEEGYRISKPLLININPQSSNIQWQSTGEDVKIYTGISNNENNPPDAGVYLNGTDAKVNIGDRTNLKITGEITIECWVKSDVFNTSHSAFVAKGDTAYRLARWNSGNNANFGTTGVNPVDMVGTTNINDGEWHHIVGVLDGTNKILYVDGQVDATSTYTGTLSNNTEDVNFGENGGRWLRGWIKNVKIYSRGLSAQEVLNSYNEQSVSDTNLQGCWLFNEHHGDWTFDSSGNGYNGQLINTKRFSDFVETTNDSSILDIEQNKYLWLKQDLTPHTKLLCHFDGDNDSTIITDVSEYQHVCTAFNNAKISTAESVFGGSSIRIPAGGADRVEVTHHDVFNLSTLPIFTIDFWIRWVSVPSVTGICGKYDHGPGKRSYSLLRESTKFRFVTGTGGITGSLFSADNWVVSQDIWYHAAVVYDGTNITFYSNGVSHGGGAMPGAIGDFDDIPFHIGVDSLSSTNRFNGYIDEFRFSRGIVRWTSNFTPPSSAYAQSKLSQLKVDIE